MINRNVSEAEKDSDARTCRKLTCEYSEGDREVVPRPGNSIQLEFELRTTCRGGGMADAADLKAYILLGIARCLVSFRSTR